MERKNLRQHTLRLLLAIAAAALLARLFVIDIALVDGASMAPIIKRGALVFVFKAAYGLQSPGGGYLIRWGVPSEGEIVAAYNPRTGIPVVKRVGAWPGPESGPREKVFLAGENAAESVDSRDYGPVPIESLWGRVILLPP